MKKNCVLKVCYPFHHDFLSMLRICRRVLDQKKWAEKGNNYIKLLKRVATVFETLSVWDHSAHPGRILYNLITLYGTNYALNACQIEALNKFNGANTSSNAKIPEIVRR